MVFKYCRAAVSWGSKKQKTIALSSCEAEIVACSDACKEGVYLSRFLQELGLQDDAPTPVHVDNTGARSLAYNPEHHERTKHIDRRHFWVRELVEDQKITVPFVKTDDNMADFFTKPLAPRKFVPLRNLIMNFEHDYHACQHSVKMLFPHRLIAWGGVSAHTAHACTRTVWHLVLGFGILGTRLRVPSCVVLSFSNDYISVTRAPVAPFTW